MPAHPHYNKTNMIAQCVSFLVLLTKYYPCAPNQIVVAGIRVIKDSSTTRIHDDCLEHKSRPLARQKVRFV